MTDTGGEKIKKVSKPEKRAIQALKDIVKIWPKTLWIFADGNTLCVMRYKRGGIIAIDSYGSIDDRYVVDTIDGIPSDGGAW